MLCPGGQKGFSEQVAFEQWPEPREGGSQADAQLTGAQRVSGHAYYSNYSANARALGLDGVSEIESLWGCEQL